MVWASTKIKKRAADAFEAESIETEIYSLQKPEGFLHVIGDDEHEFKAYSRDFGEGDNNGVRQATIEIDALPAEQFASARDDVLNAASDSKIRSSTEDSYEIWTDETANGSPVNVFYKFIRKGDSLYRLRYAVLPASKDEYSDKVDETLNSFELR